MYLGQFTEHWAQQRPDAPALMDDERTVSFRELDKLVNRAANGLKSLGITHGDRVAIMLPNVPEFVYTFYACQKIGAVAVPFNTMYKGREIQHILRDSGAKAIVCLTNFVSLINEIRPDLPDLLHIITTGERTLTFADPESTLFVQAVLAKKLFDGLDDAYVKIGTVLAEALQKLGVTRVWYRHCGSVRAGGKKLAGIIISEVEDIFIINALCFIGPFQPADFFAALWVPPEVKDKMLEPMTSLEEELGHRPDEYTVRSRIVAGFEETFSTKLTEGTMTREERFGYQKQRGLMAKSSTKKREPGNGIFGKLKGLFGKK